VSAILRPVIGVKAIDLYFKYFIYTLFILAPVFSNYIFYGKVSIGDLFFIIFVLYYLGVARFSLIEIFLIIFSMLVCTISFYILYQDDFNPGFYRATLFFIFVFLISSKLSIDSRLFIGLYIKASLFFSVSLMLQWFFDSFLSISVPLQLPIEYYEPDTLKILDHGYRSGGWFKEPSYFMLYITPLLFYFIHKQQLKKYIFLIVAGVLSTSSLVFFIVLATLLFHIIKFKKPLLFFRIIALILTMFFIAYLLQGYLMDFVFYNRVINIFLDGGTLNQRVGNSLVLVQDLSGLLPNVVSYDYFSTGGDNGHTWFSSLGAIFASFGLIGLILITIKIIKLDIFFGVVLMVLMFSTNIFSNVYAFFIIFAFMSIKKHPEFRAFEEIKSDNFG